MFDNKRKKTLYTTSSGKCGINTSKKVLRYSVKIVLQSFFDNIKKYLSGDHFLITIIGPKKIKKMVLETIALNLKGKNLIVMLKTKNVLTDVDLLKKRRKNRKA